MVFKVYKMQDYMVTFSHVKVSYLRWILSRLTSSGLNILEFSRLWSYLKFSSFNVTIYKDVFNFILKEVKGLFGYRTED